MQSNNGAFEDEIEAWIAELPDILTVDDGIGLFALVSKGRHVFQLAGEALAEFITRCLRVLLEAGAIPMNASGPGTPWKVSSEYGVDHSEIINNVVSEWVYRRQEDPTVHEVWFGLLGSSSHD